MKPIITWLILSIVVVGFVMAIPSRVLAQEETPVVPQPDLLLTTPYPSQVLEMGKSNFLLSNWLAFNDIIDSIFPN